MYKISFTYCTDVGQEATDRPDQSPENSDDKVVLLILQLVCIAILGAALKINKKIYLSISSYFVVDAHTSLFPLTKALDNYLTK